VTSSWFFLSTLNLFLLRKAFLYRIPVWRMLHSIK